jgi:hypothetical protein
MQIRRSASYGTRSVGTRAKIAVHQQPVRAAVHGSVAVNIQLCPVTHVVRLCLILYGAEPRKLRYEAEPRNELKNVRTADNQDGYDEL